MPTRRFDSTACAKDIRALSPQPPTAEVVATIEAVREAGDAAVIELSKRFGGGGEGDELHVEQSAINAAPGLIDIDLLQALKLSIENVRRVAETQRLTASSVLLPQGQRIDYRVVPVARAAAYIPGGRGAYPSTAVMCLATARAAGVEDLCVLSPPRENGHVDAAVLAVCSLLGVTEVIAAGGAQAIAAAALGTESIDPVDVIVGPGNSFVQEAKRQLTGTVGIDSVAGPSELVIVADASADAELVALDLLAQGEHGPDSLVVLISTDQGLLDAIERRCDQIGAELALVRSPDLESAVELADAIAAEHMQLMVADGLLEGLAAGVKRAGALFVGSDAATAFGDYVAGSNHVLPTGGSARHKGALSAATFQRRMAEVRIDGAAANALADAGATIARAEGFTWHADSMEARKSE